MKKIIEKIRKAAHAAFKGSHGSHGWDHTERVVGLAMHIGRIEGADPDILLMAALLHDIGRQKEDESLGAICHAEEGARLARKILSKYRIDESIVDRVADCIEQHRYRKDIKPVTLEAKILFDADKLDAIGAVGIGRAFLFSGEHGSKLHNSPEVDPMKTKAYGPEDTACREFMHKLRHLKGRMLTREGKRLAKGRHDFMVKFFKRLDAETRGII